MIAKISDYITHFFLSKNFFDKDDYKYYQFGFNYLISEFISWLLIVVIAVISDSVIDTIIYFFTFMTLRHCCGGYHAKTHTRCSIIFIMTYIAFLILLKYKEFWYSSITCLCVLLISFFLIMMLAPIESEHKKCSSTELKQYRKKSIIYSIIFTLSSIIAMYISTNFSVCIILGMLNVALSLVIAYFIKERRAYK